MSATIYLRWPGRPEAEQQDYPQFSQDCHPYATWITDVLSSSWLFRFQFRQNGFAPLLSFHGAEEPDRAIQWTTPDELEAAALKLKNALHTQDKFALKLVKLYQHDPGVETPAEELAIDLGDVAQIARFARQAGAKQIALTAGW